MENIPSTIRTVIRIIGMAVVGILVCGISIFVWCGLLFWLFGDAICDTEIFQEVYSPDEKNKVVVYERNCGATTGFGTHISVFRYRTTLKKQPGNVFRANGHPDWFEIKVEWKDNKHLLIEHNGKPIPSKAKERIRDIEIQYIENLEGIMPPRSFKPNELLLPVSCFPKGWSSRERRPSGPEEIKGSKENNPYMQYDSPTSPTSPTSLIYRDAKHSVSRLGNIEEAVEYFSLELNAFQEDYSIACTPSGNPLPIESSFCSEYTENFIIGFTEHKYGSSGEPRCKMIAQYDEFFITFEATISENGLTHEQFNDLVIIIDKIMVEHLQQNEKNPT